MTELCSVAYSRKRLTVLGMGEKLHNVVVKFGVSSLIAIGSFEIHLRSRSLQLGLDSCRFCFCNSQGSWNWVVLAIDAQGEQCFARGCQRTLQARGLWPEGGSGGKATIKLILPELLVSALPATPQVEARGA